jgi:hypothetical protein
MYITRCVKQQKYIYEPFQPENPHGELLKYFFPYF